MNQEKIRAITQMNQHHEMLSEQLRIVEQQIKEIATFDEELEVLETHKDKEILAPLGKSVYAKMKIKEGEKFFVEIGAGYFVRKSIQETKQVANEQRQKLEMFRIQIEGEIDSLSQQLEKLLRKFQ